MLTRTSVSTFAPNAAAEVLAAAAIYLRQNIKGDFRIERQGSLIMQLTTVMVVALIAWCGYTLLVYGGQFRRLRRAPAIS